MLLEFQIQQAPKIKNLVLNIFRRFELKSLFINFLKEHFVIEILSRSGNLRLKYKIPI